MEIEEVKITRNAETRREGFCGPVKSDGNDFDRVPLCCQFVIVCDWLENKRCIVNLAPVPCQYSGRCFKYAHHLCANKWAFANNIPEGGIGTYCKDHHPGYQSFITLSMNQLKVPPELMIATSAAPDHVQQRAPGPEDESADADNVMCLTDFLDPLLQVEEPQTTLVSVGVIMPHKAGLLASKFIQGDPNVWHKCYWSFQETCHLKRYNPTPCQIERCQNFTHTKCAVLWCCKNHIASGGPKRMGLFSCEHLPGYFGMLNPRKRNNHDLHRDFILQPKACEGDTYEPCVGDLNSSGLWFAPKCKTCFQTNKYLHMENKLYTHLWEEVR